MLLIYDFDCPAAAVTLERKLAAIGGVLRAYVNPATQTAYVDYDSGETNPKLIAQAIEKAGYSVGPPIEP